MSDSEVFLQQINTLFGRESVIRKIDSTHPGMPPLACFIYRDLPEPGMTTGVTYGLSVADHPDWRYGKPELVVSVKSADESWALAAAFIAERFRGDKSFTYGSLFSLDAPICAESEMCGFFVFAPAVLDQKTMKVELPTKTVNIVGMYPIYRGEIELIREIGLEEFWRLPEFKMYDVKRRDLSTRG